MDHVDPDLIQEIKNKSVLHWNYRGLVELPGELENFGVNIKELYLKENQIIELPRWINELSCLTNLYLSGNRLKEFPMVICQMHQLKVLDLSGNSLENLPSSIGNLQNLTDLFLDENCLSQLPAELGELACLECLSICKNSFVTLPEWLGSLKQLGRLLADDNCLEELPNRLTLSSSLRTISIGSNRLKYLPLNSFISPVNIHFSCNPNLNYLSYPMLSQLLELGWNDGKYCFSNEINPRTRITNLNLKLVVKFNELSVEKSTIIELPRHVMKIFKNDYNEPVSLWEMSLRTLYQTGYDCGFRKPDIFHKIMANGPISVCLSNKCQKPIFTEAWLIVGTTEESSLLVVSLFCSQRCLGTFDAEAFGIEDLAWEIYSD